MQNSSVQSGYMKGTSRKSSMPPRPDVPGSKQDVGKELVEVLGIQDFKYLNKTTDWWSSWVEKLPVDILNNKTVMGELFKFTAYLQNTLQAKLLSEAVKHRPFREVVKTREV